MADDPAAAATGLTVAPARRRRLFITSGLILGNELMERLAYYSLSTDLVTRLDMLGASSAEAATATMVWQGACYLVSIFGAWIADAWLGRYWTIVAFSSVYMVGLTGVVLSTGVAALGSRAWLMAALYVVALGTGGIKANVSSYGADQFDDACPAEAAAKSRYFNAFYFVINVGALIASLFVVNVQASVSWLVGYAIPAAAFAAAFAFFLAGTPLYVHVAPRGSPFARLGAVFAAAAAKWRVTPPADPALLYESDSEDEGGHGFEVSGDEEGPLDAGDAAEPAAAPDLLQAGRGWSAGATVQVGSPLAPQAPPSRRSTAAGEADDDSANGSSGLLPPPRDPFAANAAADVATNAALAVHHDPPARLPTGVVRAAVRSERLASTRSASEAGWAGAPRPLSAGVVSQAASSVAGALSRAGSVGTEGGMAPTTPGSGAIASASAAAAAAAAAASGVRRRTRAAVAAAAAATAKAADAHQLPTVFLPPSARRLAHTSYATWLDRAATPLAFYYQRAADAGVAAPPPPGGAPLLCCCDAPLGPDDAVHECDVPAAGGKSVAELAAAAAAAPSTLRRRLPGAPRPHRRERHLCSVTQTEETKRMLSFLPICLSTIVFSAVYAQMSSTFVLQGRFMNRTVGRLTISSATLSAFNTIAVLICVPVWDLVVVPAVRRMRRGRAPTYLQRIGAGLALSVVTMAVAAGVEAWRLRLAARGGDPPSVFWLSPQYALVGASEVCAFIGLMELCYSESPDSMRSLASSLQLVTGAVGSFLSSAIVAAVEAAGRAYSGRGWLPDLDDGYEGRLDLFYALLMVISAANLAFFIFASMGYQYKVLADPSVRAGKAGLAALAAVERGAGGGEEAEARPRRRWSAGTA